jgi:hypothetical protein
MPRIVSRRRVLQLALTLFSARGFRLQAEERRLQSRAPASGITLDSGTRSYVVHPGASIQDALEAAARDSANKTVRVHAGTYRPAARGQALIWFNARRFPAIPLW